MADGFTDLKLEIRKSILNASLSRKVWAKDPNRQQ
jgi:hypothetical protein